MAGKLTARRVTTAKAGKYSDGGNLYLIVSETGARKWVLRFTWRGRAKEMGLGTPATVPLADAREKAATARRKIAQGLNPIDERKRTGGVPPFGEVADQVREALSAGFRNEKHKAQWKSTLATYAAPLNNKPVDTVTTDDVLAILKPIWTIKPKRPRGYGAGSKRYWTLRRPKASERARTRRGGAAILTTCYRAPPSFLAAITPQCPTTR